MALVGIVLVGALLLGRLLGGRLRRLALLPLAGWPMVALAAAAQVGGGLAARAFDQSVANVAGSVLATALVAVFLVRNRALQGVPLVALGMLLNAIVVTVDGAMPVSAHAAARAGVAIGPLAAGSDARHELATGDTALRLICDRIPLALPFAPEVLSVGDVLIAAGLGLLVVTAMTGGARYDGGPGQAGNDGTTPTGSRATTLASASTTRGSYS